MVWTTSDFVFAAAMVVLAGIALVLALRTHRSAAYRAGAAIAVAAAFLIVWINGAVGILGSEGNPRNRIYEAVIAIALAGALAARFRPRGMARALLVTAVAQALAAVLPWLAGWGAAGLITLFFAGMWLASAWLFARAAREPGAALR